MFEDTTSFDLDDDGILETSFTPATSSTQTSSIHKRCSNELDGEHLKKVKLSNVKGNTSSRQSNHEYPQDKEEVDFSFTSFKSPSKVVKRKFPGPAGLLPERTSSKSILELISYKTDDDQDDILLCSQRTVSVFEDGPWKDMTKDFYVPNGECLYEKFNISWIKRQASLQKLLVNHKAPFLAGIIQSLEIFDGRVPTVNVTLKDTSGDIQGTVLHSLYEEYSNFFTVGSVLVLKQFGVLSAGYNNHCLTITPNNLVTIYSLEAPKKPPNTGQDKSEKGLVRKVVIQECKVDEIIKKYCEDVLASEEKQRSINFGKLRQNHSNLLRANSVSENNITLNSMKSLQNNNNEPQKSNLGICRFQNNFNRTVSENKTPNVPLEALSKVSSNDIVKKKFNFKQSGCMQKTSATALAKNDELVALNSTKEGSFEDTECDNLPVSKSQILVKSASKEHQEIWKNILQDVDADALFDDF